MSIEDDSDEFAVWFNNGIDRGWITPSFCGAHDPTPLTVEEEAEDDDFFDRCVPLVRIRNSDSPLAFHQRWGNDPTNGKL